MCTEFIYLNYAFSNQSADIYQAARQGEDREHLHDITSSWERDEIFASGLQKVKISVGTFPSGGSCKCQGELLFQQLPRTDFHSQND